MTELQFLITLLTKHKLPNGLKDVLIERMGEVEANLAKAPVYQRPLLPVPQQAPSTQRLLEQQVEIPQGPIAPPKPVSIDKETGRAMVNTGKGTFGPRKF